MSPLLQPLRIREVQFKNRVFMSPMCQYSSVDGMANEWHRIHLGTRATGGVGLVITEAAAVSPIGRITPADLGIWNESQQAALKPIVDFIKSQGAIAGIQLAHAGRKASTAVPWEGGNGLSQAQGGWIPWGPSAMSFNEKYIEPKPMIDEDLQTVIAEFSAAAARALAAGFEVIEIHMAHGYLLHEFLSPLSNQRTDKYGGSLENRLRFPLEVTAAVRKVWPAHLPLFVRISATDWVAGGWDLQQSIQLCKELKKLGVDLIDASSGGLSPLQKITVGPHYQVQFAEAIRKESEILTGAVGMITEVSRAEGILQENKADVILLARELLRNPYWALQIQNATWPKQYERARP